MNAWLPVIATLAGAFVGGGISILVTWLSNRGQVRLATLKFEEERAIWAANRRLDQLREFHRAVEALGIAAQNYRITTAWRRLAAKGEKIPTWVEELGDTRAAFYGATRAAQLDVSLIDDDLLSELSEINDTYANIVMVGDDPTQGMVQIERQVECYRKKIAQRYRDTTKSRLLGNDCSGGEGQS